MSMAPALPGLTQAVLPSLSTLACVPDSLHIGRSVVVVLRLVEVVETEVEVVEVEVVLVELEVVVAISHPISPPSSLTVSSSR